MNADSGKKTSGAVRKKILVIGAGFAGIETARALRRSDADITVLDRSNHHLFQPLLFHVATSILEPAEIATPIRSLLRDIPNIRVEMREAVRIDLSGKVVVMNEGTDLGYDFLVIATGAQNSFFGHEGSWAGHALGLKSLGDAIAVRNRLLKAFERAELETDPSRRARDMTVVVVGGGPTGVAITGTISELIRKTLARDFRTIDVRKARVVLVQAGPRLLPEFSERHSEYAADALRKQGVEVRLGAAVTEIDSSGVTIGDEQIESATVLWCTGVQGASVARTLQVEVRSNGTIAVQRDLSIPGHPDCFVVGDAACVIGPDGRPLPGLASIAQHQGRYVGQLIAARLLGKRIDDPFRVTSTNKIATISRHVGVAEFAGYSTTGFLAWLMWGVLHLRNLSDRHARISILGNWLRFLVTYRRSAHVIVEQDGRPGAVAPRDVTTFRAQGPSDHSATPSAVINAAIPSTHEFNVEISPPTRCQPLAAT